MSDAKPATDLRTVRDRIAAALKAADKRVGGFISYEERADAVIRDLGLRKDTYELLTRYVTEWTTNA